MRAPLATLLAALLACGCAEKKAPPAEPESEAAKISRRGLEQLSASDLEAARASFINAKAAARNEPHGRLGLAALAFVHGDTAGARAEIDALVADGLKPEKVAPFLVAVVRAEQPSRAVAAKTEGTGGDDPSAEPKLSPADRELAELFRAGHYNGVIKRVESDEDPSVFRRKLLADAHYNLQNWEAAVSAYRKVLAKEPSNEGVTQYLADALFRLSRYDESIRFYRVLAEAHKDKPCYWKMIGGVATAKKDNEVALAAYTKAVEGGCDRPEVKAAITTLRKALEAAP